MTHLVSHVGDSTPCARCDIVLLRHVGGPLGARPAKKKKSALVVKEHTWCLCPSRVHWGDQSPATSGVGQVKPLTRGMISEAIVTPTSDDPPTAGNIANGWKITATDGHVWKKRPFLGRTVVELSTAEVCCSVGSSNVDDLSLYAIMQQQKTACV